MSFVLVFNSEVEAEFKEAYQWYDTQKKGLGERGRPIYDGSTKEIIGAKVALQTLSRGIPVANGDEWVNTKPLAVY